MYYVCISQKVKGVIMGNFPHTHVKTEKLADFQICISVPLKLESLTTLVQFSISIHAKKRLKTFDFLTFSGGIEMEH